MPFLVDPENSFMDNHLGKLPGAERRFVADDVGDGKLSQKSEMLYQEPG